MALFGSAVIIQDGIDLVLLLDVGVVYPRRRPSLLVELIIAAAAAAAAVGKGRKIATCVRVRARATSLGTKSSFVQEKSPPR